MSPHPLTLLTRFAIRPDSELSQFAERFEPGLFQQAFWLEERLELMERFLLPSLRNQSDRDFRWLLGCDETVDSEFVDRLRAALDGIGEIVISSQEQSFSDLVESQIPNQIAAITVRIDSDDAIGRNFVSSMKSAAVSVGYCYNFARGIGLDLKRGISRRLDIPSSPFVAYVSDEGKSVLSLGHHAQIGNLVPVVELPSREAMFLKVLHDQSTAFFRLSAIPIFFAADKQICQLFGTADGAYERAGFLQKMRYGASFVADTLRRRLEVITTCWAKSSLR